MRLSGIFALGSLVLATFSTSLLAQEVEQVTDEVVAVVTTDKSDKSFDLGLGYTFFTDSDIDDINLIGLSVRYMLPGLKELALGGYIDWYNTSGEWKDLDGFVIGFDGKYTFDIPQTNPVVFSPYLRAKLSLVSLLDADASGVDVDEKFGSFAFGLGCSADIQDVLNIFAEFSYNVKKMKLKVSGLGSDSETFKSPGFTVGIGKTL